VATNLADALQRAGRDVLIVDADRQRTASRWAGRRQADTTLDRITATEATGNLFHTLDDLSRRYDDLIVDAGGHDSVELRTALVIGDHIYSPVQPSQADLETLATMTDLVDQAKAMNSSLRAHLLLTRTPTNPSVTDTRDALELLSTYPIFDICSTVIRDRKIFRDAMFFGKAVIEMGDPKATAEVDSFAREVMAHAEIYQSKTAVA
jgi:chromosome partitioning protein